ncbi:MAG: NAD(P) transhydrogenase subunit alpha [Anaerolineae bacterium]|nr:NAD(P) transhydrogenase subunit alpha [Anaerolineae bacterium]
MIIAIPKEIMSEEKRVAAIPETVEKLVKMGFKVTVETKAGEGIFCGDEEYTQAGAEIITDVASLYAQADIILKVKEPRHNDRVNKHEIEMMKGESILITFLHPAAPFSHKNIKMLRDKGITSFTMDSIPRTSKAQRMDALTSMSTVTGYKAVLIAANRLPKFIPMIGTAIGSIKPANFLVVGVGVVGLQAIATVKRLGGIITVVDIRPEAREAASSLGAKIGGFEAPPELAIGKWGYARALPAEWLAKEREALTPLLAESDAVILSALIPGEVAPILITDEMVAKMKAGSVIVDVSIDQGGNCAITEAGQEIIKHNIFISGLQNIPGRMPVHATWLYANNIFNYVENLFKKGVGELDLEDEIVQNSLVTRHGKIVHAGTLKALGEAQ